MAELEERGWSYLTNCSDLETGRLFLVKFYPSFGIQCMLLKTLLKIGSTNHNSIPMKDFFF